MESMSPHLSMVALALRGNCIHLLSSRPIGLRNTVQWWLLLFDFVLWAFLSGCSDA